MTTSQRSRGDSGVEPGLRTKVENLASLSCFQVIKLSHGEVGRAARMGPWCPHSSTRALSTVYPTVSPVKTKKPELKLHSLLRPENVMFLKMLFIEDNETDNSFTQTPESCRQTHASQQSASGYLAHSMRNRKQVSLGIYCSMECILE